MQVSKEFVELDPDKPFQGLGFRGWLRLVFVTRAGMIRQHDLLIDMLMHKNNEASARAERAEAICAKVGKLCLLQHSALVQAELAMFHAEWGKYDNDQTGRLLVYRNVQEAIRAGNQVV